MKPLSFWRLAVSLIVIVSGFALAEESGTAYPEQLGPAFITALSNSDREGLIKLIHPAVFEFERINNWKVADPWIDKWLKVAPPKRDKVSVLDFNVFPDTRFNERRTEFTVKGKTFIYPASAEMELVIEDVSVSPPRRIVREILAKSGGRWYIVLPSAVK